MNESTVIANGQPIPAKLPCTIEAFLVAQQLLPRSVVVEHNGEAVAPSLNAPAASAAARAEARTSRSNSRRCSWPAQSGEPLALHRDLPRS